ncbi:hypothetical protein niasHT_022202 [Heterodera trifolii]|uniref:Cadherin domain-containing protein n=1 Tax=Heterodera trifolii TaxID=157864 RepID=A0ABD2JNR1_9BILA
MAKPHNNYWHRHHCRHSLGPTNCCHCYARPLLCLPLPNSAMLLLVLCFFVVPTAHWAQQQMPPAQPLGAAQFFQPIISFKASTAQQQQPQQMMYNGGGAEQQQQQQQQAGQAVRISRFDPTLKTKSNDGYLSASAGQGTFVRIGPTSNAPPLQILVEDRDLLPGMPSAVYHYILTGYGAEHFAVDHLGNLYLNVDELDTDATGTPLFVLHVMAREVDTTPQRSSAPISLTVHLLDDDMDNDEVEGVETEQEQDQPQQHQQQLQHLQGTVGGGPTLPQTVYVANVSAAAGPGERRVIAQVKARESESNSAVLYRIVEVSDGAVNSFRYDHTKHELSAIGPLYPGHRYKARDTDGLVGHAVVLVQALAADHQPSKAAFSSPASSAARASLFGSGQVPVIADHQPFPLSSSAFVPPLAKAIGVGIPPALPASPPSAQMPSSFSQNVPPAAGSQQIMSSALIASSAGGYWQPISNGGNNKANANQKPPNPFWRVDPTTTLATPAAAVKSNPMLIPFATTTTAVPPPPSQSTEQTLFVELSESAPVGTLVTSLGNEFSAGKVHFVLLDEEGNIGTMFGMEDEQEGTIVTKGTLDREQTAHYKLRIEARSLVPIDQLLYVTILHVNVLDANDNAPHFAGSYPIRFNVQLDESPLNNSTAVLSHMNMLLGRIEVNDADQGQNGKVTLNVMPPLDRLFSINDNGELRVNGALSAAHLGEHQLTLRAVDNGAPPLESRTVVSVRIDGRFASPIRETLLLGGPPPLGAQSAITGAIPAPIGGNEAHHSLTPAVVPIPRESRPPLVPNSAASAPSSSADYESGGAGTEINGGKLVPLSSSLIMPSGVRPPFTRIDPRMNSALLWAMSSTTGRPPLSMASLNLFSPTPYDTNLSNELSADKSARFGTTSPPTPFTTPQPSTSSSSTTTKSQSSASSEELGNAMPRLAPVFDSAELKVFVEENEGQMELTRLHAHYPDGGPGPITYTLRTGDQSIFSVDPISGKVMLLRALDAESEQNQQPPVYRLKVGTAEQEKTEQFVMEPGLAHSCEMIVHVVDTNDWIPNFAQEKYEFKIAAEAVTNGTIVGQVVAFDQDLTSPNNKIRYELSQLESASIVADQWHRLFQINTETGQIIVANARQLANLARAERQQKQQQKRLHFVAKAIDGGLEGTEQKGTAQVDIVVELGEEEAQSATTTMGTRIATGGNIVDDGNEEEEDQDEATAPTAETMMASSPIPSALSPDNSQKASKTVTTVSTAASPPLAEAAAVLPPSHSPPMPSPAATTATVPMQFVARTFSATVAEGQRPPVLVKALAVDNKPRDTRFTICAIREGNSKGPFSVTPNARGDCELRTQMQLDRESVDSFRLNVSIQNGVQMDSAIVTVSVLDANDNKPKFVVDEGEDGTTAAMPLSSAGGVLAVLFAVLPSETEANEPFFALTARDVDTVESGNGLVTYALDEQMPSAAPVPSMSEKDATFFGINTTTGKMFVQKKASEIVQLTRRDYFRVTASACDNPLDETNQRLCSRMTVAISVLTDQHKFVLMFAGVGAEQIRHNEKKIVKALRPFTDPCPEAKLLTVVDQHQNDADDEAAGGQQLITSAVMYSLNTKEQKLCQKQELQKLFTESAKQQLAATMREELGAELLDVFGGGVEDGRTARSGGGGDGASAGDGIAALLFPIDWNGTSTMLITISLAVALVALVGLCALFIFRARHHKQMRRRAQQMRRRRGFSAGGGLLTVSNMKGGAPADGSCLFSGIPSYCAGGSNNGAGGNVYLPNTTQLGGGSSSGGIGIPTHCPFERSNKFYESQRLELPIGGDDDHNNSRANPSFAAAHGANGMRLIGASRGGGTTAAHDEGCPRGGGGTKKMFRPNGFNNNSPPHRQLFNHSPPQQQANSNRRKPHATASSVPAECFQRYYSPPHHHHPTPSAVTNHEGDFSVDESFYAANGQRCAY